MRPEKEVFYSIADLMQTSKLLDGGMALGALKNIFNDLDYEEVFVEKESVVASVKKCIY